MFFFCCMEISQTQGSASIALKKLAMLVNALYGVRITFYESIYVVLGIFGCYKQSGL